MKLKIFSSYQNMSLDKKIDFLTSLVMLLTFWIVACLIFDIAILFRQSWMVWVSLLFFLIAPVNLFLVNRKKKKNLNSKTKPKQNQSFDFNDDKIEVW